jgi:hypothetical protein
MAKRGIEILRHIHSKTTKERELVRLRIERDYLAMFLYCCDRQPELVDKLIDFYICTDSTDIIYSQWVENAIHEFDLTLIEKFGKCDIFEPYVKRKLIVLGQMLSVLKLNEAICGWFPSRNESVFDTLFMLNYCERFVWIALDEEFEHSDPATGTLAVIRRELLQIDLRSKPLMVGNN